MHGWVWFETSTATFLFDWDKADQQMVYEAISQTYECLNSECHDNTQE